MTDSSLLCVVIVFEPVSHDYRYTGQFPATKNSAPEAPDPQLDKELGDQAATNCTQLRCGISEGVFESIMGVPESIVGVLESIMGLLEGVVVSPNFAQLSGQLGVIILERSQETRKFFVLASQLLRLFCDVLQFEFALD